MAAEEVQGPERTVLLKSSDGAEFVVSELEASQSLTFCLEIRLMVNYEKVYGVQSDSAIRPGVKSNILSIVIEYFRGSHGDPHWCAKFIDVDLETLCDLIMVSCFICLLYAKLIKSSSMICN
jgi:hypothetical protein